MEEYFFKKPENGIIPISKYIAHYLKSFEAAVLLSTLINISENNKWTTISCENLINKSYMRMSNIEDCMEVLINKNLIDLQEIKIGDESLTYKIDIDNINTILNNHIKENQTDIDNFLRM